MDIDSFKIKARLTTLDFNKNWFEPLYNKDTGIWLLREGVKRQDPGLNYIRIDENTNEAQIQCSAKIFGREYPFIFINPNTIERAVSFIQRYLSVTLDNVLYSETLKFDVTRNVVCESEKLKNDILFSLIMNMANKKYSGTNQIEEGMGGAWTQIAKTKAAKRRLVVYDKYVEMHLRKNTKVLERMDTKYYPLLKKTVRVERNFKNLPQIREVIGQKRGKVDFANVLNCGRNVVYEMHYDISKYATSEENKNNIFDISEECSWRETMMAAVETARLWAVAVIFKECYHNVRAVFGYFMKRHEDEEGKINKNTQYYRDLHQLEEDLSQVIGMELSEVRKISYEVTDGRKKQPSEGTKTDKRYNIVSFSPKFGDLGKDDVIHSHPNTYWNALRYLNDRLYEPYGHGYLANVYI